MGAAESLDLITRIRSGRGVRTAQEELYRNTREALLGHLEQRMPERLRSRLDPEDVLHEAFLRAMTALDGFHAANDNSFFAWVYTIARNLITDASQRRSAMALPFSSHGDGAWRGTSIAARGRRVSTEIARREWIASVLGRLRDQEAEVIRMRLLAGMSFEEIGSRWKKTPGAVQRFYSRACQRFRELAGGGVAGEQ